MVGAINVDQGLVIAIGKVRPRVEFLEERLSPIRQVVPIRLQIIEPFFPAVDESARLVRSARVS